MNLKKLAALVLALSLALPLTGCGVGASAPAGGDSAAGSASADTITLTDQADNTVTVPAKIDRIAVYGIYPLPSVLSVFFHSAEKIVAMPKASMTAAQNSLLGQLYPEILKAQTDCVSGTQVNTEELMKLKPDVVFYSASDAAAGQQLRNAGFAAVAVSVSKWNYNCIETLNNWIDLLSQMFPQDAKADAVKKYSDDVYQMVQQRVSALPESQRVRIFVLFQYSDTTMLSSGRNFFGQWWCDAVGAVNVGQELTTDNSVQVNMEQVYAWNPEVILMTNFTTAQPQDLYDNAVGSYDWSGVAAIQNKRVYKMPLGLYRSYTPGADTPVTLLWLAKTVYPDLFQDIDVTAKAKEYYKTVFGVDLTDAQINSIFAPDSAAGGGI